MTDQDTIDRIHDALDGVEKLFLLLKARQSERYWQLQDQHMSLTVITDRVWHHTSYSHADTTPIVDGDDVLDEGDQF